MAEILERVQQLLGVSTDTALAEQLGKKRTAIAQWRKRGSIDIELIVTKCAGADLNWLLRGTTQQHTMNEPTEEYHANEILSRQSNVSAVYDAEALRKKFEADLVEKLTERERLIKQNAELQEKLTYMQGQIDAMKSLFATLNPSAQKPQQEATE